MKNKIIEEEWCTYYFMSPSGVGKIIKEFEDSIYIKYYQDSNDTHCWDKRYIKKFKNIDKAIEDYSKGSGLSLEIALEYTKNRFPSAFQEKVKK